MYRHLFHTKTYGIKYLKSFVYLAKKPHTPSKRKKSEKSFIHKSYSPVICQQSIVL